jgi:transposase
LGSKRHLIVDGHGTPLAIVQSGANAHESPLLAALIDAVPRLRTPHGGRRQRPAKLHADKAYASRANRAHLRRRHIKARIARKGIEPSERLGRHRWKVERTFSWLNRFRRLKIRYERSSETYQAFLLLAASLIALRRIEERF